MTLLYGKDSNGNQVPLLVDASGVVQTTGGGTTWPGTSSQLTAGNGTAVTVGSGLSLASATLTATQMPAVASTAVNRWRMNESSGTSFTDSIASAVLSYSPLGSATLTYGANRVMALSTSVDFAPTSGDTTAVLSCASAAFPAISTAGQARMIEAFVLFNNIASPTGANLILFGMRLNTNNRVVCYASGGTMFVYGERQSVVLSNITGPSLAGSNAPFGVNSGNRTMHLLMAEDANTFNLYVNGQIYSPGSQPSSKLYAAGTYTLHFANDIASANPTSVEIAEVTLHNGLTPTGYASTQAYATARAMLLNKFR